MLRKTIIAVASVVLLVCAGCESHEQSRKVAKQRWDKTTAKMKLALAQQQVDTGDYEKAAATIQQCLTADPENSQAHLLYGKLLLAKGRCDEAIEQLNRAVELDGEAAESWYWLGIAAEENRDYQKAYEHYRKALWLEPLNVDYILAVAEMQVADNNYEAAMHLLTQKMLAIPREVSLKVAVADLMLRQNNIEEAIRLYEQVVLLTDDRDIAESLGYCYMLDERWDKAAEIFEKLASAYKGATTLQKEREIQTQQEQKSKALLQLLAICNMNAKQYGRAISCYSKLAAEDRESAQFWLHMGQAALGAGAAEKALMCGQKALALRPDYADAIVLVGCAHYAKGNYAAAIGSFEKIATDRETGGFSWFMRARCYEQLGEKSRANHAYQKALQTKPHSELIAYLMDRELSFEDDARYE